jgi:hypothetical protein
MANAAIGEVDIELGGKIETLKSSIPAARTASQVGGGFIGASARVAAFDFDTVLHIVAAGLGKKPADVERAVFEAGMPTLSGPVSTFITYLANGGKPPKEDSAGTGEA